MRMIKTLATVFMIMVCIAGCSKKSALEGQVVDGKGKPVAGIKMIAKQTQPIKGFEQFETTTIADGSFKFGNLFPNSEYDLVPDTDKYLVEFGTLFGQRKVESGPEGQTKMLYVPFELRFATPNEDEVTDTKTGLTWARNANIVGREMSWTEASTWAYKLNYAGHSGWRLPTKEELEFMGDNGYEMLQKVFSNVQKGFYWSSTAHADYPYGQTWYVDFHASQAGFLNPLASCYVWPVR